nr:M20 family metallopeptidase [uncultured Cohaesibacter sp.]
MSRMLLDLEHYLEDLEKLVNIDSGSHDRAGVLRVSEFFAEEFTKLGWQVSSHEVDDALAPCLEMHSPNAGGIFDILILGHMDTVFPEGTVAERPFRIEDGRAYGPGVMDMKAGDLFALHLARAFHKSGEKMPSICVAFNSHEEIGSRKARPWIEALAAKSRCAFILEPARANGDLVYERKGCSRYHLAFHGKAAHSGVDPQNGASAVNELAHWVIELHKLTNFDEGLNLNAGLVAGGTSVNAIAERAEAEVDVRLVTLEQAQRVQDRIDAMQKTPFTEGVRVEVSGGMTRPPMNASKETQALCYRINAIASRLDIRFGWQKTGGGSDGNFTAALGLPTIDGMGPIGGRAHSRDEYLEVDSIAERFALLVEIVRDFTDS